MTESAPEHREQEVAEQKKVEQKKVEQKEVEQKEVEQKDPETPPAPPPPANAATSREAAPAPPPLPTAATPAVIEQPAATAETQTGGAAVAAPSVVMPPASGRSGLYILMLNLLYPAVLGTIFYTFLQMIFQGNWLTDRVEMKRMIYAFGVVCHYHIDFLYVFSFEVYKRLAFIVDLAIVVLLYRAFAALTPPPPAAPDFVTFFLCFLLVYLIFLPHELVIMWRYKVEGNRELIMVHLRMLIHEVIACTYFIICMRRPDLADSVPAGVVLLLVTANYVVILRARTKHKKII